jgi:hypothetical protein
MKKAQDYFSPETLEKAIYVDGHYKGWLNPEVVEKYGLESNAREAWEKNGGGSFSYKNPKGDKVTGSGSSKGVKGWSSARVISAQLFRKNPNAYFYRHNEPDKVG